MLAGVAIGRRTLDETRGDRERLDRRTLADMRPLPGAELALMYDI